MIEKEKIIWIFYLGIFSINLANSIVSPLYPIEALKRGITEDLIGLIYSAHPLMAIIISFYLGKKMNTSDRK